ncbi:valyl-tRNA synthetase 2, mitochondrial (putative)-like protein [Sarcoptes scabiei]|uniref:valine--tRNA ligase n=1 Tax=Sarcoptes scabiei TaxID=52283 RepID=A0A132AN63_SARSC|nr:valyl-tRNA synthetase 2, mitochondrial (putative)-like protein [Sarcoptes scabiei]
MFFNRLRSNVVEKSFFISFRHRFSTSTLLKCSKDRDKIDQNICKFLANFPDTYSIECEKFWSKIWDERGLFKDLDPKKESEFRLLLPPPNITGSLHLGHALTVAIQDSLCRYHRMNGHKVKWYGGTDHAGIATQIIVSKILKSKYGLSEQNVDSPTLENVFQEWQNDRIKEINSQLKSLGVSIDFTDNYYTLSPEMSKIINKAFIELFDRDLVYRGCYMVNWSYYLQSTLSDIEIEHKFISKKTQFNVPGLDESFTLGVMHYFKYPLERPDSCDFITIATTRIESLMGDVAVCVHPSDTRYTDLIGKFAFNPFTNQKMPILADYAVKPDFGTGILKLTPAHSVTDYEIANRHKLPLLNIFDDRGCIQNSSIEAFNGIHRYKAKDLVKNELIKRGLYCREEEHAHWIPMCSRSGDIIESRLTPQWFLRTNDVRFIAEYVVNRDNLSDSSRKIWEKLASNLDDNSKNVSIIPSSYRNTWKDWFSRYKDWCISRQIYWGHRIPAYEILHNSDPTNIWIAAESKEDALTKALQRYNFKKEEIELRQDCDVLDTWFSSALLPLAMSNWSKSSSMTASNQLPLTIMETGFDIIFFWVARMILLSVMLTNRLPFDRVLLHGMICDEGGKKMSKSKGNHIDPLHLIKGAELNELLSINKNYFEQGIIDEKKFNDNTKQLKLKFPKGIVACGADILRLSLLQSKFTSQSVRFDSVKTIKQRQFANKMHQTLRFVLKNLDQARIMSNSDLIENLESFTAIDRWILQKQSHVVNETRSSFCSYDFYRSARLFENFWIEDLCDVYLEYVKNEIANDRFLSFNILIYLIETTLKILHPFMPFITENLYQKLRLSLGEISHKTYFYKSILDERLPDCDNDILLKQFDPSYSEDMVKILAICQKIRWFRQNFHQTMREKIFSHDSSAKMMIDDDDEQQQKSSLKNNEIYLLLQIDINSLQTKLEQICDRVKSDQLKTDLNRNSMLLFTENHKKLTKILS